MADNKPMGMLVDYEYCTGCHSCEVSCKQRFELGSDEWGIKVAENGPWKYGEGNWEWDYIPIPTDVCDLCADRREAGKKPLCEQHCQALVIQVGPLDELQKKMTKRKMVLFTATEGHSGKEPIF